MTRLERKLAIKKLFIDTTVTIIKEEGIEKVSIRKIAKITGYNSATLYTYFKNLDYLILLSSLKFLKECIEGLNDYIIEAKNPLEESVLIWEFFCKCSFKRPKIYSSIFFSNLDYNQKNIENSCVLEEFYKIYPEDIPTSFTKFENIILKLDLYERNKEVLINLVDERFITLDKIEPINDLQLLIYKGLLEEAAKTRNVKTRNFLCDKAIRYIKNCYNFSPCI
ncbi:MULTISPECIES: TetR/AcrR family transcriptional regulator [Psychrilyobacter]|uniref:TetR family transcriptional regulator n=1 Tax=Psychrilyobacter piezotolerans TaxID=2293438 RepID=A0ABX9KFS5_9FUSO|nr:MULTISPECIES: TetR/AcrR family transcriptional regulator [Psychrilyobacter]MCS5420986.1 TetR/AcrR family transcriptional regulator [Psychrilyobacter sp. S5]NDI78787.1 TetR/AcrR family transcriptional regulator [Psychrilyobacter piezotolerans]RDE60887.1 TetR/AcrR family transcriptional regulator [Psychrilyobacter sp. S5]REI40676.1 TetR family transcriptional regulator [Psychrilyobacter piezotolerans]